MPGRHLLFVTGKLAEPALRRLLDELAPHSGFTYAVAVLPISVAALATTPWIARHLTVPPGIDQVILPGACGGDLAALAGTCAPPVQRGPRDLRDLPEFFGRTAPSAAAYGAHDIEILAEINHVGRLTLPEILKRARHYRAEGADVIDLGCDPDTSWGEARDAVRALCDEGLRVSIDSFNPREVEAAVSGGAELVLSVNAGNREQAASWGCEVVALPDVVGSLEGLEETVAFLGDRRVPFRIDPVIEPIGFGLATSLGRFLEVRRRYPEAEILMGVGNLTELTDVDSAGVNVLLAGFCQELGIRSVLTTQVINWCRSAVGELALARRLTYYACKGRVLPKHREPDLILLRDPKVRGFGPEALAELAAGIRDRNFRIFAEEGRLHVLSAGVHLEGSDPFVLFEQMSRRAPIDPSHAFYLGYEMAKAVTALTLGKNYVQDEALRWGFLTVPEAPHRGTISESPTANGEDPLDK